MRRALVALVLGFSLLGCGGIGEPTQPAPGDVDMARAPTGTDGNGGQGGSGGGGAAVDMRHAQPSTDMAHSARDDMGSAGDMAGLKPFGTACTANAQCASDACFMGGMQSFCSLRCTQATAAQDCPVPPTTGVCNNQGYCK